MLKEEGEKPSDKENQNNKAPLVAPQPKPLVAPPQAPPLQNQSAPLAALPLKNPESRTKNQK